VRPFLVHSHQTRIPGHVGGKDRSEASDRGHSEPAVGWLNQMYVETWGVL
jgi:hypothetical protein